MKLRVCVDISDMERAVAFYRDGLGLTIGRRYRDKWTEMLGAEVPLDLLRENEGSVTARGASRTFSRHWTPVHLDFVVDDVDAAVARAVDAGASVDQPAQERPYGRIAVLADPFGNRFCLLKLRDGGYEAMLGP
jgi:predicted enzyme related to lactoylglutathione lyase